MLYPLKFIPQLKERVWGGTRLTQQWGKPNPHGIARCGESWEISGLSDSCSIVANGFLAGNTLNEVAEIYMADLLGDSVFDRYGTEFPLLIKFIDANDDLSVQVHPNDQIAQQNHQCAGKSELWYIIDAQQDALLISGFNTSVSADELKQRIAQGTLAEVLHHEPVAADDALYIPAGRVHAINRGVLLAEVQQASDITYRLYDYNRPDQHGQLRPLHIDQALEVADLSPIKSAKLPKPTPGQPLHRCEHFTINHLKTCTPISRDLNLIDSFIIYICTQGYASIQTPNCPPESISAGQTMLIPAELKNISIHPTQQTTLLEVYI